MKKIITTYLIIFLSTFVSAKENNLIMVDEYETTNIKECDDFIETILTIRDRMLQFELHDVPIIDTLKPLVWNDFAATIPLRVKEGTLDATLCLEKDQEHKRFLAELIK